MLSLDDSELEATLAATDEPGRLLDALYRRVEQRSAADASDEVTSKAELAPAVGMSVPMLERYIGEGAHIQGPPYSVSQAKAEVERIRDAKGQATSERSSLIAEKHEAEIEARREQTRAKRLANDLLEGNIYRADVVDQYLAENAVWVRTRLEQLPDVSVRSVPSELRAVVREAVRAEVESLLLEMAGRAFEGEGRES